MSSETLLAKRNVSNSLIWPFCTKVFDMKFILWTSPVSSNHFMDCSMESILWIAWTKLWKLFKSLLEVVNELWHLETVLSFWDFGLQKSWRFLIEILAFFKKKIFETISSISQMNISRHQAIHCSCSMSSLFVETVYLNWLNSWLIVTVAFNI